MYVYLCHVCAWCLLRPEECVRSSAAEVPGGCKPSYVGAGSLAPVSSRATCALNQPPLAGF